jgi:hypothetical protein
MSEQSSNEGIITNNSDIPLCKMMQESTIRRSYEREQRLIELHTKYPNVPRVNSFDDRSKPYSHYPQTQGIKLLGDLAMLFGSALCNKIKENKVEPEMSAASSSSSYPAPAPQTSTSTGSRDPTIASQINTSVKMYFVVNNSLKREIIE